MGMRACASEDEDGMSIGVGVGPRLGLRGLRQRQCGGILIRLQKEEKLRLHRVGVVRGKAENCQTRATRHRMYSC